MGHDAYDEAVRNRRYNPDERHTNPMNNNQESNTADAIEDCERRAHAFISRSETAEEVTLPGWLARKISAYILFLEDRSRGI